MGDTITTLIEGSERLSSLADVDEVVRDLARLLRKLVKSRWIAVYFFDRQRRDFSPVRASGLPQRVLPLFRNMPLAPDKVPLLKGMLGKKQHLIVSDPATSDLLSPVLRKLLRNVSLLAVPMVARTQVIGAVFMGRTRRLPPLTDQEIAVIRDMVAHAALLVSHIQLFDETLDMALDLAGRIDVILTLDEINKAISSSLSRDRIMQTAMEQIERITQCEFVAVLQADDRSLAVTASHAGEFPIPVPLRAGSRVARGRCIAWSVYRTGHSRSLPFLAQEPKLCSIDRALLAAGVRSLLAIPIMARETVQGVLLLGDTEDGKFATQETFTIEKIASQMAVALENARLFEDMRSLFINTVSSLANAIDAKSPWTKGHSERVMQMSVRIAKELKLPEEFVERVRLGGLLHDIGKIGIIEALLEKPARLSEEEFPPMRLHPGKGVAILAPIAQLKEILPAILYHHERMDGSGYPEGLAGDDIPLEARIIAVADSFDAMVAERPYKRALTVREATEELQSCAGTHFDRAVVDAFCAYIERITRRGNEDYSREAIRKGIAT